MGVMSFTASVSFARTPLREIGEKVAQLEALGWHEHEDGRGDPWAAAFVKQIAEGSAAQASAELQAVMGDYWIDAAGIRELLDSARRL